MNILIAEDEKDIRNLLAINLEEEGYTVFATKDGLEGLSVIQNNHVDLAILDVMMPHLDGFNLLRKIRETSKMPIVLLTARGDDMDKVLGLGLGADDYLVKPFSMAELLARVSAHLRRNYEYIVPNSQDVNIIKAGRLSLDKDACCVYKDNKLIELNAKEFLLLKYFMENQERVFTKKQLYMAVWNEDCYWDDNTIMVHISHLRNKIETNPKDQQYIKTIRGIGYKFQKQPKGDLV